MPNIVEITDFTGTWKISTDQYTKVDFDDTRDEVQFELIYEIMGATMGQAYIDDLNASGVPADPLYLALYNSFTQDDNTELIKSEGIKAMVKYHVYFRYIREQNIQKAITGNVENKHENAQAARSISFLIKAYNRAIETAKAIQWYICQNSADYPDYNGQELEFITLH